MTGPELALTGIIGAAIPAALATFAALWHRINDLEDQIAAMEHRRNG